MDIYIVVHRGGNRRTRAKSPMMAWLAICPDNKDVIFKSIDNTGQKLNVLMNNKQIGRITRLKRGRGGS